MKPLTPLAASQRYAARQSVVWLLALGEGDDRWLAASRAISFDGEDYPARIAAPPEWKMESASPFGPGGVIGTSAEIRVADDASDPASLRAWIATRPPIGLAAELNLLWIDPAQTWTPADAVTMLKGKVVSLDAAPALVNIRLLDKLSFLWKKKIGRELLPSMIAEPASPLLGRALPIVFGVHDSLPLLPLRPGAATKLESPLASADLVARVASLDGFPSSGQAQIGDELIAYTAIDVVAKTLGTAAAPISRSPGFTLHSAGEPVRSVPVGGFQWLVADHACNAVANVRADGVPLDPADWTAELRALGAYDAQVVTMPRWPTTPRYQRSATTRSADEIAAAAYTVAPTSTALDAAKAIDGQSTSTYARLQTGVAKLHIRVAAAVASAGRDLGMWSGASLRVRYSASKRWKATSSVAVSFVKGASTVSATVPRPDSDAAAAGVQELALDLAPAIPTSLGWGAFDAPSLAELRATWTPDADDTVVKIHDVELRLSYFNRLAAEEAREVVARVEGWPSGFGEPIQNPVEIIDALLLDARFGGIPAGEVDYTSAFAAFLALYTAGYAFSRVVDGGESLGDLVESAARESALWLRIGGALANYLLADLSPPLGASADALGAAKALDPLAPACVRPGTGALVSDSFTLTAPGDPGEGARAVWTRNSGPPESEGRLPVRSRLRWLDGRSATAIEHLGERLWASLREPFLMYEQSYPLGAAALEPGDSIAVDRAVLNIVGLQAWAESLRIDGASRVRVAARIPQGGDFCWLHDGETFMRLHGFGLRLVLQIGGVPVAELDPLGSLRLRGALTEEAAFASPDQSAPIAFDGTYVYLSAGAGPPYPPFARIDAFGNLALNGTVRERSDLPFDAGGACHGADATRFWIALAATTCVLDFRPADALLHLKGALVERSLL